ncbi:hypothetical protein [Elizabethkingia anophelis]|uniref:hypothetical protein n=1 Tax=Elizabethkingia anophelis TaxID=1117645 RepID=UPI002983968F|nr:hypothetical protein [Elizabethkingia anophelis]HAY3533725.1 hypothetical protein [Elizabethkingia anophelis]HAY3545841.1 hypothetical protein [Elizabethkingia anophelis]HAY3590667.1 hypothetical protein [Elizabethkingia anophelis]
MLNKTYIKAKRKTSLFVTLFRKTRKQVKLPSPTTFGNLHQGTITFRKTSDNAYMAMFQSLKTNRRAHAWGNSFEMAYSGMINKFNEKYC